VSTHSRRFDGRTVLVTGVGRRGQVGEAVAAAFAAEGAALILVDRELDDANARAAELRAIGADARAFACDLANSAQLTTLAAEISGAYAGRLNALVALAGGFAMSGPIAESDPEAWQRQIDINLTTAFLSTRAFLPLLRPAAGAIVYFASAAALPGGAAAGMAAYAAAKAGVVALMRAVSADERPHGVRANAVAPTAIRTAANLQTMGEQANYVERNDVASAVCFLCSTDAQAISGQVVRLG
jgi:NAD(P)-dependent dehydrogenase (short-subunit alcohol dehydrogenase family)